MDRPSINLCAVCFCAVIILSLTACGPTEEQLQELVPVEKITVHWLAVDNGSDPTVAAAEQTFVENFNKSQDEIELVLEIADAGYQGLQHLDDLIESGNPPDIIGPYGPVYANLFLDQLLDIEPLIGESFNLGDLDLVAVDAWRVEGRLIALPMGYWPAVIYYNKDIFDKAGLPYPPHQYNKDYKNRDSFINAYYSRYPNVDWQVMLDSLNYPDNPSYTQFIPNSREVLFQLYRFGERIISNSSTKIDKELDFLEDGLQSIISK